LTGWRLLTIAIAVLVVATSAMVVHAAGRSPDAPAITFFSTYATITASRRIDPGFRIEELTVRVQIEPADRLIRVDYHFVGTVMAERVGNVYNWAFPPQERLVSMTVDGEPVPLTPAGGGEEIHGYNLHLDSLRRPLVRGRRFDCTVSTQWELSAASAQEPCIYLDLTVRLCELLALYSGSDRTFRMLVTVPPGWRAFWSGEEMPGRKTAGGTTFTWATVVCPLYNYPLAAGPFHPVDTGLAGVQLHLLQRDLGQSEQLRSVVRETTSRALEIANRFGLPPLPKLDIVLCRTTERWLGGKSPRGVIFMEVGGHFDNELDLLAALISHEIWHQWFPGTVVPAGSVSFMWLSEAMTSYFDIRYMRNAWPPFKAGLPYPSQYVPPEHSIEEVCNSSDLLKRHKLQAIHLKGSWVVHMLQDLMGEKAFRGAVREFFGDTSGNPVSVEDFQAICERHSGIQLGWFFDQWLRTTRTPRLKLADLRIGRQHGQWVVYGAVCDRGDAILPPVEVAVLRNGEKIATTRVVLPSPDSATGIRRAKFTISLPFLGGTVVLDPDFRILNAETAGLSRSVASLVFVQVGPWAAGFLLVSAIAAVLLRRRRRRTAPLPQQ